VRLKDVDAAGVGFFARLLEYPSGVFVAFCASHHIDLADALRDKHWGAPVRHAEAHQDGTLSLEPRECYGCEDDGSAVARALGSLGRRRMRPHRVHGELGQRRSRLGQRGQAKRWVRAHWRSERAGRLGWLGRQPGRR
jgi:hypothetical protein